MAITLPSASAGGGSSFGTINNRIADELVRPDLLASHIPLAVNDAIKEAAGNRFWFNEVRSLSFDTVPGQAYYQQLSELTKIDAFWIVINGQRRNMEVANQLDVNCWNEGQDNITGEPAFYSRYGDGVELWMTPREVWRVYVDGVTRFSELVIASDESPYLIEGERYIRALAKANLLENVIRDFGEADRQWQVAEREKRVLLTETSSRISTNRRAPFL